MEACVAEGELAYKRVSCSLFALNLQFNVNIVPLALTVKLPIKRRQRELVHTLRWSYSESALVAGFLDDVDNIFMMHAHDVHVIHGQNPISDVQFPAALGGASLDYTACQTKHTLVIFL